jgi:3-hydroxyisobutyrate dehydrogenase
MKYGYIGLGNLGGHIAASLQRAGHQIVVNDIDKTLGERHIKAGATWASSPQDLERKSAHGNSRNFKARRHLD